MEHIIEFGLEIALLCFLAATVFYCWLLNRRIQVLQDSKSELAGLLRQFDQSTKRATHATGVLQRASAEAAQSLQARIEKAQYISDDLDYMTERANKAADQMEAGIAIARQKQKLNDKGEQAKAARPAGKTATNANGLSTRQAAVDVTPILAQNTRQPVGVKAAPVSTATRAAKNASSNGAASQPTIKRPAATASVSANGFESRNVMDMASSNSVDSESIMDMQNLRQPKADKNGQAVTRDSVLASLRQAKSGGKESTAAISSLQSLIEKVSLRYEDDEAGGASKPPKSRGERALMQALAMQPE